MRLTQVPVIDVAGSQAQKANARKEYEMTTSDANVILASIPATPKDVKKAIVLLQ
jgi:hypothetical protein